MQQFIKTYRPLLMILLLVISYSGLAQTFPRDDYFNSDIQERSFDAEKWKTAKKDISYFEKPEKVTAEVDEDYDEDFFDETDEEQRRRYGNNSESGAWDNFFKILFIIMAVVVIAALAVNITGNADFIRPKNRKIRDAADGAAILEQIEENIYESDLDRYIREAIESGQYALAIRLYYLAVIKELSLNRTIRWKRDKTNKDYMRELRQTNLYQPFREATRVFERVWYGKGEFTASDFESIQPRFVALLKLAEERETAIQT